MKGSYTSAEIDIPIKILHDSGLMKSIISRHFIFMRHLQLCPTNRCNLRCVFCSCRNRNSKEELPLKEIVKILDTAKLCGCRAVTITGGGEPLLHPEINTIIKAAKARGIKAGLVTNGLLLGRLNESVGWCRISFDSSREFKPLANIISRVLKRLKYNPPIDWAFSFVAFRGLGELKELVKFANAHHFTHVRVVNDILHPDDDIIDKCKKELKGIDQLVIYQSRSHYTQGREKCWISLLKPTIAADGNIYPCCGAQYAIKNSRRDFNKCMVMGKDLERIIMEQLCFDGSKCDVCYYESYNVLLALLMGQVLHKEWV